MPTDARQGMEGAKNAYRGFQEAKRADTPNQGLSGPLRTASAPCKAKIARNRQPLGWQVVVDRRCCSDDCINHLMLWLVTSFSRALLTKAFNDKSSSIAISATRRCSSGFKPDVKHAFKRDISSFHPPHKTVNTDQPMF
ncbi:hypothetical protein, partial [Shigella sonnei]|uniref:hypothetical protein n=1 Tax=Shigella sonnei TaxID=624 RepID=UPI003C742C83